MASFQEIANKKVAGVPVIYLAGAFVVILAFVAYKLPSKESAPTDTGTGTEEAVPAAEDYSSLATTGTVTVVQSAQDSIEKTTPTNEEWARTAVGYLIESKVATPSEAEAAIAHYLAGANLSFAEGKLKDAAILKLGLPPEPLATLGSVGIQPARKQIGILPGTHKVVNSNDNSITKLASLYYGKTDPKYVRSIASANPKIPMGAALDPGTSVVIPAFVEPRYYTAGDTGISAIAVKNGTTTAALKILNPGMSFPVKKGTKVRVA